MQGEKSKLAGKLYLLKPSKRSHNGRKFIEQNQASWIIEFLLKQISSDVDDETGEREGRKVDDNDIIRSFRYRFKLIDHSRLITEAAALRSRALLPKNALLMTQRERLKGLMARTVLEL